MVLWCLPLSSIPFQNKKMKKGMKERVILHNLTKLQSPLDLLQGLPRGRVHDLNMCMRFNSCDFTLFLVEPNQQQTHLKHHGH